MARVRQAASDGPRFRFTKVRYRFVLALSECETDALPLSLSLSISDSAAAFAHGLRDIALSLIQGATPVYFRKTSPNQPILAIPVKNKYISKNFSTNARLVKQKN